MAYVTKYQVCEKIQFCKKFLWYRDFINVTKDRTIKPITVPKHNFPKAPKAFTDRIAHHEQINTRIENTKIGNSSTNQNRYSVVFSNGAAVNTVEN